MFHIAEIIGSLTCYLCLQLRLLIILWSCFLSVYPFHVSTTSLCPYSMPFVTVMIHYFAWSFWMMRFAMIAKLWLEYQCLFDSFVKWYRWLFIESYYHTGLVVHASLCWLVASTERWMLFNDTDLVLDSWIWVVFECAEVVGWFKTWFIEVANSTFFGRSSRNPPYTLSQCPPCFLLTSIS
jgi:hypothetical protein